MGYINELTDFVKRLEEKSKKVHKIYRNLPKGHLIVYKDNKYIRFVLSSYSNGNQHHKGIKKNLPLVKKMVYKEYLKEEYRRLDSDITKLKKLIPTLEGIESNAIKTKMPHNYQLLAPELYMYGESPLITPDFTGHTRLKSIEDLYFQNPQTWQSEPYRANTKEIQNLKILTSHGFYVRSKSEASIADIYVKLGIPFHYDEVIDFGGNLVSPDFIAIRDDGQPIFHEHCGLMDNPVYLQNYDWKMSLYRANGILPWKNLIITYDNEDGGINLGLVEEEIKAKLLDYDIGSVQI